MIFFEIFEIVFVQLNTKLIPIDFFIELHTALNHPPPSVFFHPID